MSKTEAHPSDVAIARLLLGKASEEEARAAAAHAAGCNRCRAELDAAQAARSASPSRCFRARCPRSSGGSALDRGGASG
jgi:anti-sigma factor RsiW